MAEVTETVAVGEQAEKVDTSAEEIAALKAQIAELESGKAPREIDYVWPAPTAEQKGRNIVGGEAVVRVVKITYTDVDKQFWDNHGEKTVHIGQYRYPRAGKQWDEARLFLEMKNLGIMLIEDAFPEAEHYCEVNNCWNAASFDGAFCHPRHREVALTAHDRMISFE